MKIKGVEYTIIKSTELFDAHDFDKNYEINSFVDGYADVDAKVIYLYVGENNTVQTTLLHELTHAFLYESGMKKIAENEVMCDWIAGNLEEILLKAKEILHDERIS